MIYYRKADIFVSALLILILSKLIFYNLDAKEHAFAYRARFLIRKELDCARCFNKYSFDQQIFEYHYLTVF